MASFAKKIRTRSGKETKKLAEKLIKSLKLPCLICLYGELGSGKTTFVKGLAGFLGIKEKNIKSPTFVFLRTHKGKNATLHHFDFYRLKKKKEFEPGLLEIINHSDGICAIEWPEHIQEYLPRSRINIYFNHVNENTRDIKFAAQ